MLSVSQCCSEWSECTDGVFWSSNSGLVAVVWRLVKGSGRDTVLWDDGHRRVGGRVPTVLVLALVSSGTDQTLVIHSVMLFISSESFDIRVICKADLSYNFTLKTEIPNLRVTPFHSWRYYLVPPRWNDSQPLFTKLANEIVSYHYLPTLNCTLSTCFTTC